MRLISRALGSAHASRAGERVLAIANFRLESLLFAKRVTQRKVRFGATPKPARETRALPRWSCDRALIIFVACWISTANSLFAQADPASEPAVLAVAKVLPAVVNINTERVVRRTVRDPFEDVYAQFFGYNRIRPRQIRQTLQSLGSGFIIDPGGYIVTNQHVVERAADLKIHVTTNDGKTYNAHYITGDDKTDLAFGIASAKMAFTPQGVPTQGLGFAIPAQVVRDSVNRFKKTARIQPTTKTAPVTEETSLSNAEKLFGMQLQNLSQELSDALGYAKGRGVLIAAVEPGSPADEGGAVRGLGI